MKSSILISMAMALLPLSMAMPTTTLPTTPLNPLLDPRQASCTDLTCRRDTDCYGNRCGDCDLNIGKCTCPPEANGGPC
ncbi:Ecp48 [Fulvia fulva]|uniref:Ecp48 n=1 Tax=Passalora fulva TaxID=5499 RepID=A0A1P8YXN0_PASFU|nr:Ecp48 [Fulvia fulva]AQA29269.1 extracellular protein 48 [Fulvia fulva]KAK4626652.1 Ecp48 [Fulvia fulva]KAK4627838.1 Ecp48 [Fulvia fulva]UJO22663.1 Ecp48 [Fulvia fulva]WPV13341.1 Ecp48 [Fulvia fulva]